MCEADFSETRIVVVRRKGIRPVRGLGSGFEIFRRGHRAFPGSCCGDDALPMVIGELESPSRERPHVPLGPKALDIHTCLPDRWSRSALTAAQAPLLMRGFYAPGRRSNR